MFKFIFFFVFLISSFSLAATPDSSTAFVKKCISSADCEMQLFQEISKTYRPSKEESALKEYILNLKKSAEELVWKKSIPFKQDEFFNTIIYVPATGHYALDNKVAPIALQSHMDMVLSYKFAKPGEDIRPYFKNGVALQIVDDWISSKDHITTLGADNGIGVAIALRYLLDKKLQHPPLELIFTSQEEIGLVGAFAMKIPVKSKRLICLDGMAPEPKSFIIGSQGSTRIETKGVFKGEAEKADSLQMRVYVGNLAGGHSGGDIHRDRLNAIVGFAYLMSNLYKKTPDIKILNMVAGDMAAVNKIPNMFSVVLSFPAGTGPEIEKYIVDELKTQILAHAEENHKDFEVKVEILNSSQRLPEGLSAPFSKVIAETLLKVPQGVLEKAPQYPASVKTSSNMGNWGISMNQNKLFDFKLGTMTRSFNTPSIDQAIQKIKTVLEPELKKYGEVEFASGMKFAAWNVPETSALKKKALSIPQTFNKTFYVNAGLEPSAFLEKYPQMDIIAVAPYILEAHTINERLQVSSVKRVSDGLAKLLSSF